MPRTWMSLIALTVLVLAAVAPALACESAGPNAHVGVVTAVDPAAKTFTLKDAESGQPLTFKATAEQLRALKVKDEIVVTYTAEGKALRAATIKKS